MSDKPIVITEVEEISPADYQSYCDLLPQLSPHVSLPSFEYLNQVLASSQVSFFMAKNEVLVGGLTLVFNHLTTGLSVRIEDVIVDQQMRGRGLGRRLMEEALVKAEAVGAKAISLSSNPKRIAANQLYQRLGFEQITTNVYRYAF
ncbi:MAG: GNAT family N-acetyltransferase [Saprospiraceae bacterium]|nr:GNAT family N-acetyltransferase [Saprospiraceae bacterium]